MEQILAGQFSIQQAPLVMVNILATIITRLFSQGLAQLVSPGGTLLLSGILDHQEKDLTCAAQNEGFTTLETLKQDDWISLALKKNP